MRSAAGGNSTGDAEAAVAGSPGAQRQLSALAAAVSAAAAAVDAVAATAAASASVSAASKLPVGERGSACVGTAASPRAEDEGGPRRSVQVLGLGHSEEPLWAACEEEPPRAVEPHGGDAAAGGSSSSTAPAAPESAPSGRRATAPEPLGEQAAGVAATLGLSSPQRSLRIPSLPFIPEEQPLMAPSEREGASGTRCEL
eukprot:CAMPEP_0180521272 /NCGR_PEP_ID=MMETSP1036_2-20121128/56725_1 /TAXON_ID=632150 /ORGANISM="Azadinium spinosum, Strain 3D9" /LENGTH=198 /DNA_ID=CAMNT_0022533851 /DNA_START=24 /DNA_END=616 /DNA_ORIENTATION=+